jgi:hypothetical protein
MCEGCPLQTIADAFPYAQTDLRIWHERGGQPDRVTLTVTHGEEEVSAQGQSCREAVAAVLTQMDRSSRTANPNLTYVNGELDATRIGDCRAVMVE